jgi:hypothetical protein
MSTFDVENIGNRLVVITQGENPVIVTQSKYIILLQILFINS